LQFCDNGVISDDPWMFTRENGVDKVGYDQSCPCTILVGSLWEGLNDCSLARLTFWFFSLDLDERLKRNEVITSNMAKSYLRCSEVTPFHWA
jgi:hypothetical protein